MESVDTSVNASRFSLKSKYNLEKPIHKIDFMKYSPSSLATINNTVVWEIPRRATKTPKIKSPQNH